MDERSDAQKKADHDKWAAETKSHAPTPSPELTDAEVDAHYKEYHEKLGELKKLAEELGVTVSGLPAPGVTEDGVVLKQPSPYVLRGERDSGLSLDDEASNRSARIRGFRKGMLERSQAKASRLASRATEKDRIEDKVKAEHAAEKARKEAEKK